MRRAAARAVLEAARARGVAGWDPGARSTAVLTGKASGSASTGKTSSCRQTKSEYRRSAHKVGPSAVRVRSVCASNDVPDASRRGCVAVIVTSRIEGVRAGPEAIVAGAPEATAVLPLQLAPPAVQQLPLQLAPPAAVDTAD